MYEDQYANSSNININVELQNVNEISNPNDNTLNILASGPNNTLMNTNNEELNLVRTELETLRNPNQLSSL